jgi:tetratricopeptide (TPR) repeat protein
MLRRVVPVLIAVFVTFPLRAQTPPPRPRLGTIVFQTSGSPAAQEVFLEGVLYLHSFEYESAERAFRRAQQLDPGFAMAHWGEAMTYTHPVWNEQDVSSGRSALERLGPTPEARRAGAPTLREQGYLDAVEALYGPGSKPRRDTLYALAMERLVRAQPEDLEAKAFYSLALLGLNQGVRDTATYLRAAPWADTVFRANRMHPGAAHYLIHAFDDPVHASRGLDAARAYARIAPDAAHAQHMTTHIFLALGMWEDVVAQNRIALGLQAPLPGHYSSWLIYGLIQQGRYGMAQDLIGRLRKNLGSGGLHGQHGALVDMRAHYLLHSEDWRGTVFDQESSHDRMSLSGEMTDVFTEGAIAYRRRDQASLSAAATELARLVDGLRADRGRSDILTLTGRVMALELGGMNLFLAGSREAGVRAVREASRIEDDMPMEFGPPAIVEPSHELLGWMLLEMRPDEAMAEFRRALVLAPGRSRSLLGLARAAIALGDKPAASQALAQLARNWALADPRARAELAPLRRLAERLP